MKPRINCLFQPSKSSFKGDIDWIVKKIVGLRIFNDQQQIMNFKNAILSRRCILPADSFYEWGKYGKAKIPYRILPFDGSVLFMAGIWKTFEHNQSLYSAFVIVTTVASEDLSDLHNRMPVIS